MNVVSHFVVKSRFSLIARRIERFYFFLFVCLVNKSTSGNFFWRWIERGGHFLMIFFGSCGVLEKYKSLGNFIFSTLFKKGTDFFCFVIIFKVSTAGCFHAIIPPHKVLPRNHSTRLHFHI